MAQPFKRPLVADANSPSPGPLHNQYGEEAALAAQRYHDQVREIARLQSQSDAWERRALSAEGEIKRQEERLGVLENKLDATREALTVERDSYKHRLTTLVSQFHTAGAIILKCLEAADSQAPKQVDMASLAREIEADLASMEAEKTPAPTLPEFLQKPTEGV